MRPPKTLKRVLENRNAEIADNARDLDEDTKFKASEAISTKNKRWINNDKPIFKLVLPPDLADLENSSDEFLIKPTKSKSVKNSFRQPTIEILSSGEEDLADDYQSSEMGRSSVEDSGKSLPEENSSLVNSKKLSSALNLSTPKRHKGNLLYPMKQRSIQPLKKQIKMDSEESDGDPFGFGRAEKRVRERNIQSQQFSLDNLGKFEVTTIDKDNQYNDNVQSEITKSISLNKETNKNGTDGSGDRTQSKQENKEYNTLSENDNDDDNHQVDDSEDQPTHDEGTENDKRSAKSSGLSPIKTPKGKNKRVEKKNTTPSKAKKTLKTADLLPLLPLRRNQERVSKKKTDKYRDILFDDDDDDVFLDKEKVGSDYEEKTLPKKRKVRKIKSEKSEKRYRKIKKEILGMESEDEQTKQERAERIRHAEDIDNFELAEEVID